MSALMSRMLVFLLPLVLVSGKRVTNDAWPQNSPLADARVHRSLGIGEHHQPSFGKKAEVSFAALHGSSSEDRIVINGAAEKSDVMPMVDPFSDEQGIVAFVGAGGPTNSSKQQGQHLVFGSGSPTAKQVVIALGGGTGALRGGTGDLALDRDIIRRMRYQDKAVLLMLLLVYLSTLGVGASLTYRQALNDSTVTYYADPRHHSIVTEDQDLDGFLGAFAQVPKNVQLQVTGFVPMPEEAAMPEDVDWNGQHYHVAFTFSLDLSPWVVRLGNSDLQEGAEILEDGVLTADREQLSYFLASNTNDLATVEMHKDVMWTGWEELATNIKNQIRQRGFTNGVITVKRCQVEPMEIYKNKAWANFMHSRLTKVLCALSFVGWFLYLPYMYFRCSKLVVRARYKVDVSISQYWNLICDQLCADGFASQSVVATAASAPVAAE